jgi:DNA-binding MarR family transcriptional regulator
MTAHVQNPLHTPDFTPADSPCNLFYLRRAARAVSRQYEAIMKAGGAHAPQFSVLFVLSVAGGLSITELAQKMGMDRSSMSRNLQPLQAQGLISIGDEGTARARQVSLTTTGHAVLQELLPLWRQAQSAFIAQLGEQDTAQLIALLGRVAQLAQLGSEET